jgi:hypothetical protein
MLAEEAIKKIIDYQYTIDSKKRKIKEYDKKVEEFKKTFIEEYDKLQLEIKNLEEEKIKLGSKIMLNTSSQKSFKVKSGEYEVSFLRSISHTLTQKSLREVIGTDKLNNILDHPLIHKLIQRATPVLHYYDNLHLIFVLNSIFSNS